MEEASMTKAQHPTGTRTPMRAAARAGANRTGLLTSVMTAVVLLAFAAQGASAVEVQGVRLADHATVGGSDLVLNGAGLRTKLFFKVYVGSLYLPAKATTSQAVLAQSPRRIQLNTLRDLTAQQLIDSLNEGLTANTTDAERSAIKSQIEALETIMRSFNETKSGSVVTLDYVGDVTHISLDGKERGAIGGDAFNRALTNVWIGAHPAQDDLKKALLGGA
jgi:long-chain acyl-CoA synthetase